MKLESGQVRAARPAKVLMVGGQLSNKGGIAAVQQQYVTLWNHSEFELRHIATFGSGSKLRKFLFFLSALFTYVWTLMNWRPDIVHVHFSGGASFIRKSMLLFLARLLGGRVIFHCHASSFDISYENSSKVKKRFISRVLNKADLLLVLSGSWKAFFERLPLSAPIKVLHNPISCQILPPREPDRQPVVLTLGKLGKRKGTYDILDAVPLILQDNPNTEFWLGGDGDLDQVKSVLDGAKWSEQVRLLGWVRDAEKESALCEAMVFLLPSYHEGLPIAILEAMAYGLPVVSTPVGGIPEAVLDGTTGFLVQPGDIEAISQKVTLLLQDDDLRQEMGINARRLVEAKFEGKQILQELYSIYDDLLAGRV